MKHNKDKGTYAELLVAAKLLKNNWQVFSAYGDNSKCDLIAIKENHTVKIQVKYVSPKKGGYFDIYGSKSGPGYYYTYTEKDFDVMAVYVPEVGLHFFPISFFTKRLKNRKNPSAFIRFEPPKNNQKVGIIQSKDFRSFSKAYKLMGR